MKIKLFVFAFILILFTCIYSVIYIGTSSRNIFGTYLNSKLAPLLIPKFKSLNKETANKFKKQENDIKSNVSNKSIIITGLARDIGYLLPNTLKFIEKVVKPFKNFKIIIYENDSKDNTLEILQKFKNKYNNNNNNNNVEIINEKLNIKTAFEFGEHHTNRYEKMAYFRNKYLNRAKEIQSDYDYLWVIDLDVLWISYEGFMNVFSPSGPNWDVLCTNGRCFGGFGGEPIYRDTLPIIFEDGEEYDDDKHLSKIRSWTADSNQKYYPVQSCFGGFALYKLPIPDQCSYTGDKCEHVGLNNCIYNNNKKRFYIDRDLLSLYA